MPGGKSKAKKPGASKLRPMTEPPVQEDTQEEIFQQQLAWCIEQLELGLSIQMPKSSTSQVRILKILKNPKAPLVKKRQAMHNTFGDYRKKMTEEAQRFSAKAKQVNFQSQKADNQPKYTFFKKRNSPGDVMEGSESDQTYELPSTSCELDMSGQSFKFNFSVSQETNDLEEKDNTSPAIGSKHQITVPEKTETYKNYFKMETSDSSFTFNFDISDKT